MVLELVEDGDRQLTGSMPENRDVAVLSITGVDVVLSTVPSFAHHVVGTHSRGEQEAAAQGGGVCYSLVRE